MPSQKVEVAMGSAAAAAAVDVVDDMATRLFDALLLVTVDVQLMRFLTNVSRGR